MKYALVFTIVIIVVHGGSYRVRREGWGAGWSSTTTTTLPPTTVGWSPPETTTTSTGWPAPPSGWAPPPPPIIGAASVTLEGELAGVGSGWAASNHGENVQATGGDNVPAAVNLASAGESVVDQSGLNVQLSNIDANGATGIQTIAVEQGAEGSEAVGVTASGLGASVASSGWSGAAGQALSSVSGSDSVIVQA